MTAALVTLLLSVLFGGVFLHLARRWHFLDKPNERSAHAEPTPNGGGVPILFALLAGYTLGVPWGFDYNWLMTVTLALMLLGVVDDLTSLPVALRFLLYALASVATTIVLSRIWLAPAGLLELVQVACFAFAILWALNLYNFMDGIDGIAATQCVLACVAAALLSWFGEDTGEYARFCLLLAASHSGFLVWNWAPAKLFMGDAGSVPTGFLLAGLAVYGAINGVVSFACWSVLLAVFITDASWTLTWRLATGQKFTQAHKLHAYQKLARHWGSHRAVVMLLVCLNVFWLIPIALAMQKWSDNNVIFVTLAYIPLLIGMAKVSKIT